MNPALAAGIKRFLKGLLAAGLAGVVAYVSDQIQLLPAVYIPLATAILLAVEKAWNYGRTS